MKIFFHFIVALGLISCNTKTETIDYFGQAIPQTTPVVFGENSISIKGRFEHGISFTPDIQELVFGVLDKDDFSGKIYYSKKNTNQWTEPDIFEPLKSKSVYLPYFSPGGRSILYTQSKSVANNSVTDIWMLKKTNDFWGQPVKLNSPISTSTRESTACMTLDNTIYFSSNRGESGLADLYFSSPKNGKYTNVERIDMVSSVRDEESIFVSPDEDYIIFSRYATDKNGPDLYISYRDHNKKWGEPIVLDSTINSTDWERRPFVSKDHKFLFFTKLSFDDKGLAESDIYWVNTTKVFKPFVFHPISEIRIKVKEETKISIPTNYFKDIDDQKLKISFDHKKFEWAKFDSQKMMLTMHPNKSGEFDLIFKGVDQFSNETEDKVRIIVEE
ncbi:TolB-like translocation protein [Aquimarina algicola]|uniref:Exo-alpha-sialidase n=1 Tax=Aquimarina algicola TaxID=2589995 RepID=A0A504JGL2_9FLAO|nr:PD40 domain-containing protein [Aquimarina algicola]TPN86908.1 hypothetical protein FHK87_04715 [Aquimarina algicola]